MPYAPPTSSDDAPYRSRATPSPTTAGGGVLFNGSSSSNNSHGSPLIPSAGGQFVPAHSRSASGASSHHLAGANGGHSRSPSLGGAAQPSRYLRRIPVPSPEIGGSPAEPSAPRMSRQASSGSSNGRSLTVQQQQQQQAYGGGSPLRSATPTYESDHGHGNGLMAAPLAAFDDHARDQSQAATRQTPSPYPSTSHGHGRVDGISPPPRSSSSQQQYLLPVDRPTDNMLPTYPPPAPPKDRHGRPLTGAKPTGTSAPGKVKKDKAGPATKDHHSKRDLYLLHRHKLTNGAPDLPAEAERERDEEGVIAVSSGRQAKKAAAKAAAAETELSPLLPVLPSTTWSLESEVAFADLPKNKITKERLAGSAEVEPFSATALPSTRRMWEAGLCEVQDEDGHFVPFSEIIRGDGGRRTAVFFIRHFWCGQCQDYMANSIPELDAAVLERHKIDVVIISNGHWQIIKKYREIFNCPFPIYVDGPRRLYNYLGMTLLNNDFGSLRQADRSRYNVNTVPGQLVRGIGNGLFRMPLRDPGKLVQLGGEFVFSNASTCTFAHRMVHTSDHMEAVDVLAEVGIDPEEFFPADGGLTPTNSMVQLSSRTVTSKEAINNELDNAASVITAEDERRLEESYYERSWEARREAELERMRKAKEDRRAGRSRIDSLTARGSPSSPQLANGSGSGQPFADAGEVFRRRGELDDEDDEDEGDAGRGHLTEFERERANRPWTEDEQMAMLASGLSCVRVVDGDGNDNGGGDDDEEQPPSPAEGRPREDSTATWRTNGSQFEGSQNSAASSVRSNLGGSGNGGGSTPRGGLGGSRW